MAVVCSRCNKNIHFDSDPFCSHCGATISTGASPSVSIPLRSGADRITWETDALNNTPINTFYTTLIEAIRYPGYFFKRAMSYESSATAALIFALTAGGIGLAASWLWSLLFIRYGATFEILEPLFDGELTTPYMLIFAPLLLVFQLIFTAFYILFVFRFTRFKRATFSSVLRVTCYAEAPMLLQIIPVVGTLIATPLWAYAVLTGLHHLYGASKSRVFVQLIMPFFIMTALLAMLVIAGIMGGIMAGFGSTPDILSLINQFRK